MNHDHIRYGARSAPLSLLAGLAMLAAPDRALAQVSMYSMSWSTDSSYVPITGGTLLVDCTQDAVQNGGAKGQFYIPTFLGNGLFVDPVTFPNGEAVNGAGMVRTGPGYPIGFNFTYNGEVYDRIGISQQGWISFGKSSDGNGAVAIFSTTASHNSYFPLANTHATMEGTYRRDRVVAFAGSGGTNSGASVILPYVWSDTYPWAPGATLRVETTGTPGDRVLVVQWSRFIVRAFSSTLGDPDHCRFHDFQIRLYENGNRVEVRFGPSTPSVIWGQTTNSQVGIGGHTASDFRVWGGSWSSPAPSTFNTQAIQSSNTLLPAEGLSFVFNPPGCPLSAYGLAVSDVGSSAATLSWSGTGTFEWVVSPSTDPADPNAISGMTSATTVVVEDLDPDVTYRAWVRNACGGDRSGWTPSVTFRTWASLTCDDAFSFTNDFGTFTDRVWVICPEEEGETVTVTFSNFVVEQQSVYGSAVFIHDGPDPSAAIIHSGQSGYGSTYPVPAGGFYGYTLPGPFTSTHESGCITVRALVATDASMSATVSCAAPPTCYAPTELGGTASPSGGTFTWEGDSPAYEWIIVAFGGGPDSPVIASGTTATVPTVISDAALAPSTAYSLYVRGVCGEDITSVWSMAYSFTTHPGCGSVMQWAIPGGFPVPMDSVVTVCPNNVGDVVTATFTEFNLFSFGGDFTLFVYDGADVNAPLISSGQVANGPFPAGGYYGSTFPGPFTSTNESGCLTFRFRATNAGFYGATVAANVTCGPAPACATPSGVNLSGIGTDAAIVSWTGTSGDCIVEYGPVGFTPGTGATAGAGGTIASFTATPPFNLEGLAPASAYDIYVRQVCGSAYSANSFRVRFSTSMDCSLAQLLDCGETYTASFAGGAGSPVYTSANYSNASCLSGASLQAGATGAEKLFRFTAPVAGDYQLNVFASSIAGGLSENSRRVGYVIARVEDGCGADAFTCVGVAPNAGGQFTIADLSAGDHYLLLDLADDLSGTQSFVINCPGVPACVPLPTYPAQNGVIAAGSTTPINFSWPAAFGATGYDIYFNETLVVSNHPSNAISSGSYTPASLAATYGVGVPLTWRVEPRNAEGTASCANWTFRVGGDGAANAIPLNEGEVLLGSSLGTNGFTNAWTLTGHNAPDATFSFTAGPCAQGVTVEVCVSSFITQNYLAVYVVDASTNLLVGTFNGGNTNPGTCRTLTLGSGIVPGQNYYIVVDSYFGQFDFTISYTEDQDLSTDSDGDGVADCEDECPFDPDKTAAGHCGCFAPEPGSTCDDGDPDTFNDVIGEDCGCAGTPAAACTTDLFVVNEQTNNYQDVVWRIRDLNTDAIVASGVFTPGHGSAATCVPDGCYRLEVENTGGGTVVGGYSLVTASGERIVDNLGNLTLPPGAVSTLAEGEGFCFPLGEDRPIHTSCDRYWWTSGNFLVAAENPAVSAQYGVTNTTSGYEFWFFDPNGSLSFRKFRNHATSDGFAPNNAVRACHIQLNNWAAANHLQNYVLYNVRVRGVIDGVELPYGPACRVILDPEEAACTPTGLNDILGHENYSCGVSRTFGGANSPANRVYARSVGGANKYEFEFSNANEGYLAVVQSNTVIRHLNWSSQPPLQVGSTYKVRVRASKDGGNTWCNWGWSCDVTIAPNMAPGGENLALEGTGFSMWPNPNNGQQLWMEVAGLTDDIRTIAVEIHDLSGKRVIAREVAAQHGAISLDLNGDIAAGTYVVTVIAGDQRYVERLVIAD